MVSRYKTTQEIYAQATVPCPYCLLGKCAERKAAGLCHCGNHTETPTKDDSSVTRTSKESVLAAEN